MKQNKMSKKIPSASTTDPWEALKHFTPARIALGRAGMSLTTRAHLEFQLAHARARDAVKIPLDFVRLENELTQQGLQTIQLNSQAPNRPSYLQHPDKGRILDPPCAEKLDQIAGQVQSPDIAIVIADGLSSKAVERHALPFLNLLIPALHERQYILSPICLVHQGRVAVGDHVGEIFSARMITILIGERPGLSSPDSMGIYFTYGPKRGLTDAHRNCISNIHAQGLSYKMALKKLLFLIAEADRLQLSGVQLKEGIRSEVANKQHEKHQNFLLE